MHIESHALLKQYERKEERKETERKNGEKGKVVGGSGCLADRRAL